MIWRNYRYQNCWENYRKIIVIKKNDLSLTPIPEASRGSTSSALQGLWSEETLLINFENDSVLYFSLKVNPRSIHCPLSYTLNWPYFASRFFFCILWADNWPGQFRRCKLTTHSLRRSKLVRSRRYSCQLVTWVVSGKIIQESSKSRFSTFPQKFLVTGKTLRYYFEFSIAVKTL